MLVGKEQKKSHSNYEKQTLNLVKIIRTTNHQLKNNSTLQMEQTKLKSWKTIKKWHPLWPKIYDPLILTWEILIQPHHQAPMQITQN